MNYLVRTIQRTESTQHVQKLGSDPSMFIPLSKTPHQKFSGIVVIHGNDAYVFDVARVITGQGRPVGCGAHGQQPVRDEVRIYVDPSSMRKCRAKIKGFQGFRYTTSWTTVAA